MEPAHDVNDDVHASSCRSLWHKTSKAIEYYGDVTYNLEKMGDESKICLGELTSHL